VVAFARKDIYALRAQIEASTRHQCAMVYGRLPPETRAHQAKLFNDPTSGFDVLVASDAVGMGLNLYGLLTGQSMSHTPVLRRKASIVPGRRGTDRRNIRRIVFSSLRKSNGVSVEPLTVAQIKQIAGRAGRYNSRYPEGWVTWYATLRSNCCNVPGEFSRGAPTWACSACKLVARGHTLPASRYEETRSSHQGTRVALDLL